MAFKMKYHKGKGFPFMEATAMGGAAKSIEAFREAQDEVVDYNQPSQGRYTAIDVAKKIL